MKRSTVFLGLTVWFIYVIVGILLSGTLSNGSRKTTITITDSTASFESNMNNDGDIYYIIIRKDTVSKGVFVDRKWK